MKVNICSLSSATNIVISWAKNKVSSKYVCVSNVHMCMETFDSISYLECVNSADLIVADGKPISFIQRLKKHKNAKQVRGQDLMENVCYVAEQENLIIGLYGSSSKILGQVKFNLLEKYPNLKIGYSYSPPFKELTEDELNADYLAINEAKVDILFVGLGCPKQEKWMFQAKNHILCVSLGVGAAFDFISGNKKHAPKFFQYFYLEWFYRFLTEPRRLFVRYFKHNPRFIFYNIIYFLGRNKK